MRKKVTVIGGGLAGMSVAIRLAAEKYDVTILEKGERLGGKLNIRKGNGFTFDTGPSILTMPWVLAKLFSDVGKNVHDYLDIVRVEPGWRTFFEDGTKIDLTSDLPTMLQEIKKVSVEDSQSFLSYLQYCEKQYDLMMKSFYKENISGLQDLRKKHPLKELLMMDPMKSLDQATSKFFKDKHIQQLMNFLIMYIGSSPYQAPAILSQLAHVQLGIGVYYVKGGMYKIAEAMEQLLQELGVKIHLNSTVTEIAKTGNLVNKVITENGEHYSSDLVVSNLEVIPFYQSMLSDEAEKNRATMDLKKKYEPTVSGLVLLLGVNKKYDHLAHHNFFFSEDPKKEFDQIFNKKQLADDPTVYIGISSKSDSSQAPEGKENLFVLTHVPPLKEGETWEQYKDSYRELVLSKLERMGMSDLRESIEFEYSFTPDDLKQLYGANGGSIYGVVTDKKMNGGFKIPSRSKLYENVYFVGGSTHPGGGVPMVTLSGQLTADLILGDENKEGKRIG
ncbi:diapolycopene oxygenase [Metabacillus crassostreae]|uniref:phytoene desaturase family protein n=1 Tax=Metabacillus crassostreae TaxID=929098 RepID=UPI0019588AE6|nr:phytoene desaturase family protein [Metabacillus crassostreae]MBM7605036.1 diapolycopene oxygenase [Metabacillus crassostreae]